MPDYCENRPDANILMNSMRSMGYTFESAVADIIDNSISAGAHNIQVVFPTDPAECNVAICDDGCGMSTDELFEAMKYGTNRHGAEREDNDLGRFGLGLKSASFSQCRLLTVISKKDNILSACMWDLDYIDSHPEEGWSLARYSDKEIQELKHVSWLDDRKSGTVVVWEKFDFIEKATGQVYNELYEHAEIVSNHLSLVYHRFLNRNGKDKVHIMINSHELTGLDPFLTSHNKTNARRKMKLPVMDSKGIERYVTVQPFVLPFQKDLSKDDIKLVGGIENLRTRQGFYIYRNERLIIWGTWFTRPRTELTKHARIMVDIPNTLDDIWGIDIKKQNAIIPKVIRNQMTKAVEEAMDISIRTQTYRGRVSRVNDDTDYIWNRICERDDNYTYRINRQSRIFDLIRDSVDNATWSRIDMVLDEIENTIPFQQIYIDKSRGQVDEEISDERKAEIEAKARMLIDAYMQLGSADRSVVIENMFRSEPFVQVPELKEKLLKEN